jgi:quercetin dioxygenase-like cupin family protein
MRTETTTHLPDAVEALLATARDAGPGRAAATLTPGPGRPLKQTVMALLEGVALDDHEAPDDATLQVLRGTVVLTGEGLDVELSAGDHIAIPPQRHGLRAMTDAAVLLTVAELVEGDAAG